MVNISESLEIDKILEYSGFDESAQRTIIAAYGFESYDGILTIGDSDIVNLVKGFSNRTVSVGKIRFGLRRTNFLKATIHWSQDFRMIRRTPSLICISNTAKFRAAVEAARQRASIRNHSLEESASLSKAADPGKLKRHKDYIIWSGHSRTTFRPFLVRMEFPSAMRSGSVRHHTTPYIRNLIISLSIFPLIACRWPV